MNDLISICKIDGSIELDAGNLGRADLVTIRRRWNGVPKPNPFPKSITITWRTGPSSPHAKSARTDRIEKSLKRAAICEVNDRLHELGTSFSVPATAALHRAHRCRTRGDFDDEPCSALDPIATAKIEELILNSKHFTVVIRHTPCSKLNGEYTGAIPDVLLNSTKQPRFSEIRKKN